MKLIIISGRSGSGKSTALHVLEDLGYYCIDNLPVSLLAALNEMVDRAELTKSHAIAVSIDARNVHADLQRFPTILRELDQSGMDCNIIYLDAASPTLVKRFSETRRRHPLTNSERALEQAIEAEKTLLEPLAGMADLFIDTSALSLQQLRDRIKVRVAGKAKELLALQFTSFGFKHGVPVDADFVYDVRCLPNPYWKVSLRALTGRDQPVQDYLAQQQEVTDNLDDIYSYLARWIPKFEANNRSYLTVAIGCTGGQHRSVYICEQLYKRFASQYTDVQLRHRELND